MRVHILDDRNDTRRQLPCLRLLDGHEVTVWTDHEPDVDRLASRLADAGASVAFRERTPLTRALPERLPRLRLVSMRGAWPHVDLAACTERGVVFFSALPGKEPNHVAAELAIALVLASFRRIPEEVATVRAGRWHSGVGQGARGKRMAYPGLGAHRPPVRRCLCQDQGLGGRRADQRLEHRGPAAMSRAATGAPRMTTKMRRTWWATTKAMSAPTTRARTVNSA